MHKQTALKACPMAYVTSCMLRKSDLEVLGAQHLVPHPVHTFASLIEFVCGIWSLLHEHAALAPISESSGKDRMVAQDATPKLASLASG